MKQGASGVSLPGPDTSGHDPAIPPGSLPVGSVQLATTTHELHKPISGPEGYEFVESHIMSRVKSGRWGDATWRETHIVCVWREARTVSACVVCGTHLLPAPEPHCEGCDLEGPRYTDTQNGVQSL